MSFHASLVTGLVTVAVCFVLKTDSSATPGMENHNIIYIYCTVPVNNDLDMSGLDIIIIRIILTLQLFQIISATFLFIVAHTLF